jgi:hypothetical protein
MRNQDLMLMTVPELRKLAITNGVKGCWRMNKEDLVHGITNRRKSMGGGGRFGNWLGSCIGSSCASAVSPQPIDRKWMTWATALRSDDETKRDKVMNEAADALCAEIGVPYAFYLKYLARVFVVNKYQNKTKSSLQYKPQFYKDVADALERVRLFDKKTAIEIVENQLKLFKKLYGELLFDGSRANFELAGEWFSGAYKHAKMLEVDSSFVSKYLITSLKNLYNITSLTEQVIDEAVERKDYTGILPLEDLIESKTKIPDDVKFYYRVRNHFIAYADRIDPKWMKWATAMRSIDYKSIDEAADALCAAIGVPYAFYLMYLARVFAINNYHWHEIDKKEFYNDIARALECVSKPDKKTAIEIVENQLKKFEMYMPGKGFLVDVDVKLARKWFSGLATSDEMKVLNLNQSLVSKHFILALATKFDISIDDYIIDIVVANRDYEYMLPSGVTSEEHVHFKAYVDRITRHYQRQTLDRTSSRSSRTSSSSSASSARAYPVPPSDSDDSDVEDTYSGYIIPRHSRARLSVKESVLKAPPRRHGLLEPLNLKHRTRSDGNPFPRRPLLTHTQLPGQTYTHGNSANQQKLRR